jgi:CHAT domain-containing protein
LIRIARSPLSRNPKTWGGPSWPDGVRGVRELVVVPQGAVAIVPFAALPLDRRGTPLSRRFAVRYAPSLAALAGAEARPVPRVGESVVVGNPAMPENLDPLPGAGAEGRWVAERLGTVALSDSQASEGEVRRRLSGARIVHLATHGYAFATAARVRESFVALAPDAEHDGLLTVGEVLDDPTLKLNADIVVLSACQTGLGDLRQAEGTVGLRAFLAKGARSVLVSLWSVSDEATALLMKRFYTHWLDDTDRPSKAVALGRAQEDVRARPEFREPRYWAAFQLVGAR